MRTAIVLIPELSGRGNRIYKYGEVVTENNFPNGNFDKLVKGKYISEGDPLPVTVTESTVPDAEKIADGITRIDMSEGKKKRQSK